MLQRAISESLEYEQMFATARYGTTVTQDAAGGD